MKNTKKAIRMITLLMMGVVFTATVVNAQPGREDRHRELPDSARIQQMVKHLDADLDLSAEQKTKINSIFIAHFDQMKIQREKEITQMEQMKAGHEKLRKEFENSVKAQLSPEQAQKFDALNDKREKKGIDYKRGKDHPRN